MMTNWRDYWNQDTPIYVSERHKVLHYRLVANDIAALVEGQGAHVLDHGCGEALGADRVAARCEVLTLCDGAPLVRERLAQRFGANPKIRILAPDGVEGLPDASQDLIVVNSLLQYLALEEFRALLALWRLKLKADGRLVLADVIPPTIGPVDDARALLAFAWQGGFLRAALLGLARTAVSDYRRIREELGLAHYEAEEMIEILHRSGFTAARRPRNLGHNQARMTFVARRA